MRIRKSHRMFIPPFVLEKMARSGIEHARVSIHGSDETRKKRVATIVDMGIIAGVTKAATGKASVEVFDSGHEWETMVRLVRGEGKPPTADESVNFAYDHGAKVRQYYKEVLNRNSIDNLGLDLILNVHYGENFMNAFFTGGQMVFGDGDGQIFANFTKALDVVGHELTHGVTQYTANLDYFAQSGALNESMSDVFGTAIKQYAKGQTAQDADWLIGDEIMGPTLKGQALRSMKAPGTAYDNQLMGKDPQPDHMGHYYSGNDDNQGVHTNSGIPNKAFYLTSMDIGTDKAALIWYAGLQKLWSTANFNDAVTVLTEAAKVLADGGQVPASSVQSVQAAFKAVGLPA
jgi:Zn-dependent metalloprotease